MNALARSSAPAEATVAGDLERRAVRARVLADESPGAAEPLRFAAALFAAQARAAETIEEMHARRPLSGSLSRDVERLGDAAGGVLRHAADAAPPALAEAADSRRREPAETASKRLLVYWRADPTGEVDPIALYLSRAVLRPYVAVLRRWGVAPDRVHRRGRCPFCGGAPAIALRRDGAEMEGARRFLACSLCAEEWEFGRIRCPACAEDDPYRLPAFQAEGHGGVRIEACETCRRYVKSIDLSADARPIPEVDDLLSLSLDLWATGQGFERIEPGLAGL